MEAAAPMTRRSWRAGRSRDEPSREQSRAAERPVDTDASQDGGGQRSEFELGWRAREVQEELPQLQMLVADVPLVRGGSLTGRSPRDIQARLRTLSNRYRGARAVGVRREPVPAAYRAFYRQIGLDPDVVRTPLEGVVLERMLHGGFVSEGLLADVLLIALVDTAVPVWALDARCGAGAARDPREPRGRAVRALARRARRFQRAGW